jgi:uracil-DNA glycosylase
LNFRALIKEPSWLDKLSDELTKPYIIKLEEFLAEQLADNIIYPNKDQWFAALNSTPFDQVKVVILGQDPYHGAGQAHGLSFSVPDGVKIPPSLQNIFKELERDLMIPKPVTGCLQGWADQGVLLLNATLTVEQGKAASHQGQGWEQLTDYIIQQLSQQRAGLVFVLWGGFAKKKITLIDSNKHLILMAPHPSPLSAYRGFIGCGHFSMINAYLEQQGLPAIDWHLN